MDRTLKVWGVKNRILETPYTEIDLLELTFNHYCSTHTHKNKFNKFIVIEGEVAITTEFGEIVLKEGEHFTVEPGLKHRFFAVTDSKMIEIAYTVDGCPIKRNDIDRESQGGQWSTEHDFLTLDQMREKGILEL